MEGGPATTGSGAAHRVPRLAALPAGGGAAAPCVQAREQDDVERRGIAAGTVHNDRLYLIFYHGTRLHYFSSAAEEAEAIRRDAVAVQEARAARNSQPGLGPASPPPMGFGISVKTFCPSGPLISQARPSCKTAVAGTLFLATDGRSRNSRCARLSASRTG